MKESLQLKYFSILIGFVGGITVTQFWVIGTVILLGGLILMNYAMTMDVRGL